MPVVANTEAGTKRRVRAWLPQGLFPVDFSKMGPDVIAGITLTALGIPEVMGYAKIIGTPVITGLYTLFLPVIVFAIFGSSRHLVVSADSATAAMVAAFLGAHSITSATPGYVEYARYYEAQALFQGDIGAWEKWNKLLIRELKQAQRPDGSFQVQFGNNISTSLSLLALALNYRFLPIYER